MLIPSDSPPKVPEKRVIWADDLTHSLAPTFSDNKKPGRTSSRNENHNGSSIFGLEEKEERDLAKEFHPERESEREREREREVATHV